MTTMIERLRDAMIEEGKRQGVNCEDAGLPYEGWQLAFSHIARAAIEAMREPTIAMDNEGERIMATLGDGASSDIVWATMIDAALKETPEPS